MASGEVSEVEESHETSRKSPVPHSRPEATLSDLPENEVSELINSTDFARPPRQYTDSTTSTIETSYGLNSNRSSITPQLGQPLNIPLSSSVQAVKAAIQRESKVFEALRSELSTIPSPHQRQSPRMPVDDDFKNTAEIQQSLSWKIGLYGQNSSVDTVKNIIIVLHDYGGDDSSIKPIIKKHFADPQTAVLCLGGTYRLRTTVGQGAGLCWTDEPNGISYHQAVSLIVNKVIGTVIIEKCNFPPSRIAFIGHGQGGSLALAIAAVLETTRLGGVITIDGPPPEYIIPPTSPRIPTPILMIGGKLGALTPQVEQRVKGLFLHVDVNLRHNVSMLPLSQLLASNGELDEIKTAKDFLAHSLRQEEWETQAVLTLGKLVKVYWCRLRLTFYLDGGGIRGYGSLLILKELMRRIGMEEKRLDSQVESSFHPGGYKPRAAVDTGDGHSRTSGQGPDIVSTVTTNQEGQSILDEGDLYLPCHYFNYICGTSTGGLVFHDCKFDVC